MTATNLDEKLSSQLFASLRQTGVNFIFLWLLALGVAVALLFTSEQWVVWALAVVLVILFSAVCLPNIGYTVALDKMYGGFDKALRRHVILADVGAAGTLYAVVALFWPLPFAIAGVAAGFIAAVANSFLGRNNDDQHH